MYIRKILDKKLAQFLYLTNKYSLEDNCRSSVYGQSIKTFNKIKGLQQKGKYSFKDSLINKSPNKLFNKGDFMWCFSTVKKIQKKHVKNVKKVFKLKKTKMIPNENVFLLYDGQKQQKSFQWITGLFFLVFGMSLVKLYYTESQDRRDDYIVLFIVIGSFVIYQRRILRTLKKVTLSSRGDRLNLTTFNLLAKGQTTVQAPIQIMKGISKANKFGGSLLKGGGMSGYKEMKFWFSKDYITDSETFNYVVQGRSPKIVDQYQSL